MDYSIIAELRALTQKVVDLEQFVSQFGIDVSRHEVRIRMLEKEKEEEKEKEKSEKAPDKHGELWSREDEHKLITRVNDLIKSFECMFGKEDMFDEVSGIFQKSSNNFLCNYLDFNEKHEEIIYDALRRLCSSMAKKLGRSERGIFYRIRYLFDNEKL